VIGVEGAAAATLAAADLVTRSITQALDLLLEPRALAASLRS
jgi:soluble P-type ATPase